MSDHLPECPRIEYIVNRHGYTLTAGSNVCMCNALRACEQRVADEIWTAIREGSQYKSGFEGGLDAAREAVERASSLLQPLGPALAAIDALSANADTERNVGDD